MKSKFSWSEIPEESREMLLATIRVAIKKCRASVAPDGAAGVKGP